MKRYPKIKAYAYSGFDKPKLLATSVTGLLKNVYVSHSYLGDCTSEAKEVINEFKKNLDMESFANEMADYNIYINPTKESLIDVSRQWFGNSTPHHHFSEFNN